MFRKLIWRLFLMAIGCVPMQAQTPGSPFDFPLFLSGNFGELRPNHLHSGIDFKTQGAEGQPVHAVGQGYVSRIAVSPWGYGNVVYLAHPDDGLATVYAHLQRFTPSMAEYVKTKQYEHERFAVDLSFTPEQFPVKAGEVIGYSGNSGSSAGPHLHFEVRDLLTDDPLDPLPFYVAKIKDTRPPKIHAILIYPVEGEGIVNHSVQKQHILPAAAKGGGKTVAADVEAWGKIAFSLRADDYMDGAQNVYGVHQITMLVDGREVFHSCPDRFSFHETRYINAWIDYETWRNKRLFYTKTFVEPGNRLSFIQSKDRGYLHIREARPYRVTFRIADVYGNADSLSLTVQGKEQPVPPAGADCTALFRWHTENRFGARGLRLLIPRGSLYSDLPFRYDTVAGDAGALSDTHLLHDAPVPLHEKAQLSLRITRDTFANKSQYGIVAIRDQKTIWLGGIYRDGWIDAQISELGALHAIAVDTVPPKITPVDRHQWVEKQRISFQITDRLSGVESYRGEIDGRYVCFEMDGKKALIRYAFDPGRLARGMHRLTLTVTDACGNTAVYEAPFTW